MFVFEIAFIYNVFILTHYLMYNFKIKLRIFIEDMLIHNGIRFIYSTYTFHMILNYARFANLFLMNEWLNDYIELAPEI
jgi:hypothetical protein